MDAASERQMREVLTGQQFGVLATLHAGRLHTATIHFAETPELELIHAINPASLKAEQAASNPRVAFHVDNRGVLMESRERFTRISFEGILRPVAEHNPGYEALRRTFAAKLPVGAQLLGHPEIGLYLLRPSVIRLAIGGAPAEDIALTYEVEEQRVEAERAGAPPLPTHAEDIAWSERRGNGMDE